MRLEYYSRVKDSVMWGVGNRQVVSARGCVAINRNVVLSRPFQVALFIGIGIPWAASIIVRSGPTPSTYVKVGIAGSCHLCYKILPFPQVCLLR